MRRGITPQINCTSLAYHQKVRAGYCLGLLLILKHRIKTKTIAFDIQATFNPWLDTSLARPCFFRNQNLTCSVSSLDNHPGAKPASLVELWDIFAKTARSNFLLDSDEVIFEIWFLIRDDSELQIKKKVRKENGNSLKGAASLLVQFFCSIRAN